MRRMHQDWLTSCQVAVREPQRTDLAHVGDEGVLVTPIGDSTAEATGSSSSACSGRAAHEALVRRTTAQTTPVDQLGAEWTY